MRGGENETRVFRDAGMEANNDIAARFKNMLGYIFVARCGSEMPIGHFRLPADASVGANVFSEFVSSIVPAGADALTVAAQGIPRGVPYFHVGIGPFIAASIAMQVLVAVVPSLKELTKDQVGQHGEAVPIPHLRRRRGAVDPTPLDSARTPPSRRGRPITSPSFPSSSRAR